MEITEHERVLLVTRLSRRSASTTGTTTAPLLAALLTRITAAGQDPCDACGKSHEPVRRAGSRMSRSARHVPGDDRLRADR